MLFVRHHYTFDRIDTEFWRHYKSIPLPNKLLELYDKNNNFKNLKGKQLQDTFGYKGETISLYNWDSWFTIHKGKSNKYKQMI
jgi:hypothetical protein